MFNKNSIEKIKQVFPVFEIVAKDNDCYYFDFNKIVTPSKTDGLHFTASSHKIIAKKSGKLYQGQFLAFVKSVFLRKPDG